MSEYSFSMIQPIGDQMYSHKIQDAKLYISKNGEVIAELNQNDIMRLLLTTGMVGRDSSALLNGWDD